MKLLSFTLMFLITSVSLASSTSGLNPVVEKTKTHVELSNVKTVSVSEKPEEFYGCSVTSSGTATLSDGTVIELTITVEGPCDSSLAKKMRAAIAQARADMAQL